MPLLNCFSRTILLALFSTLLFTLVNAQPGSLDPLFGNNGVVSSPYSLGKVRVQNSKIITIGSGLVNGINQDIISRYLMNGAPDASFNGTGTVSFSNFIPTSVAVQSDNKIVVVGTINKNFAVMRFNSNGSLDNTFGNNGLVITNIFIHTLSDGTPILSDDNANSVEVQTDGKIVVAGTMFDNYSLLSHYAVVRYNANGSLDGSFGQNGILISGLLGFGEVEKDMNILSNGNILVYGSGVEPYLITALGTYDPNGNFISKYLTKSPGSSQGYAFAMAVLQSQYELLGFSSYVFTPNNFPDNYFLDGSTGMKQLNAIYTRNTLQSIAYQQDGKVIVGGIYGGNLVLLRFNPDGSADNSFGQAGTVQLPFTAGNNIVISGNRLYATGPNTLLSIRLDNSICNPITVTIPDGYSLIKGTQPNTVYLGYFPASFILLTSKVSGGTPPYSNQWNNGIKCSFLLAMPSQTTTYQLTVTDAHHCTGSAQKTVTVVDVRCGEKNDKVLVCKVSPGKGSKSNTVCISAHAVYEQLKNGSYLGACKINSLSEIQSKGNVPVEENEMLRVDVYPNPTSSEFTINVINGTNASAQKIKLVVYNLMGMVVEERQVISGQLFKIGSGYTSGVYTVEVRNETERTITKLIKLKN